MKLFFSDLTPQQDIKFNIKYAQNINVWNFTLVESLLFWSLLLIKIINKRLRNKIWRKNFSRWPNFCRMIYFHMVVQFNLISQNLSTNSARHSGPVNFLQMIIPRIAPHDLHPTDGAQVVLVVEPVNLKVIFALETFWAEITDDFLAFFAVVVQDVIVESLKVLRDERTLMTFEVTFTGMSQQHVTTFFCRRFERNVARTSGAFELAFFDVFLDIVHLVRILGHVEHLTTIRALLDRPMV